MKQEFIIKGGADTLLLFFGGWGSDTNIFGGLRGANPEYFNGIESVKECDVMLCYDYTSLAFDPSVITPYKRVLVQGWSMGVWVAGVVLSQLPELSVRIIKSVAINGTPTPVDDTMGIPTAIFRGTLDNFSPATLSRFRRRMCGGVDGVAEFLSLKPCRSVESLWEELSALYSNIQTLDTPCFHWDLAVIGVEDKIFSMENQLNSWSSGYTKEFREVNAEHFSLSIF